MQRKMFFIFLSVFFAVLIYPMMGVASTFGEIIASYMQGGSYCWFCPVFVAIFKGIDSISTNIAIQLAGAFLALLAAGLLFWIVFYVGRSLLQMQPIDISKFFTDMLGTTGRAVVAAALLYSFLGIFTYLISPMLTMSMGLSSSIMQAGGFDTSIKKASQTFANQKEAKMTFSLCEPKKDENKNITGYTGASNCDEAWGEGNHAFTKEVCSAMECSVRSMSASLIGGMGVGAALTTSGLSGNILKWNFGAVFTGVVICLGYFLIFLAFPFKMIDALIRLGFVCALAPLFIVLWVFPATRTYTQKAWQMLLGSCMTFVFLAVVMVLIISILSFALPQGAVLDEMLKALLDDKNELALSYMDFSGSQFFITVAVCFIGWKLLGMAETFSSAFGGVNPQVGVGAAVDALAAKGAVGGYKAGKLGAVAGYRGSKWLGSKAWSAAKSGTKMGIVAAPMIGAGAAAHAGAAMRSAGRFLGFGKKTGADKAMSDAFKNNASMGKASYKDDMGIIHTAKRNNKGVVDRVMASKDGVAMVMEKGKIMGQLKTGKDENGLGFRNIVNDKGEIVESAYERKDGGWVTNRFKTDDAGHLIKDKDGKAIIQSQSTIERVGDKIVRRTDDGKTLTTEISSSLADVNGKIDEGNVQAILSGNGEMFRPEFEQVEKINADGSKEVLSESKFEYDSKGNMTSSVEQNYTTGQTHFRTMDSDGVVDVVKNPDGVVLSRSAQDLMGNNRGLYWEEQLSDPKDNIDKSTDWAKTDKEIEAKREKEEDEAWAEWEKEKEQERLAQNNTKKKKKRNF